MGTSTSQVSRVSFLAPIAAIAMVIFSLGAGATNCLDHGKDLPLNNDQVMNWEATAKNGFLARGHIDGKIEKLFANETGHAHFSVKIGPKDNDHIEVIYQLQFGQLPALTIGMNVEACGDFIQSNAPYNGYKPSPDGAILHWVHRTDTPKHDPGFVEVEGTVYGQ